MCFHCPLMCKFLTLPWNVHNILKNNYTVTRLRLSYGIREMVYSKKKTVLVSVCVFAYVLFGAFRRSSFKAVKETGAFDYY